MHLKESHVYRIKLQNVSRFIDKRLCYQKKIFLSFELLNRKIKEATKMVKCLVRIFQN